MPGSIGHFNSTANDKWFGKKIARLSHVVRLLKKFLFVFWLSQTSLQQKRITKELQIKALKLAFHGVCSKTVAKLNPAMCQLYTVSN